MKSEAFGNTDIKFRGFLYLNAMENEIFSDEELESIFDKSPVSYDFLKDHENIRQASIFKSNLKAIYSSYRGINSFQSLCIKALIEGNFNQQEEIIQQMFLFQIALNRLKKRKYPNNDNLVKIIKEETEERLLDLGSFNLEEILSNYEGTINNNLLKDILDYNSRPHFYKSILNNKDVFSSICLLLIEKENLRDKEILDCFYKLIPNDFEKKDNLYQKLDPTVEDFLSYYDFSDSKYSLINKSILEDETTIKMLIEKKPELILFSNCSLDDQTIENAMNRLDMNKLKTTIDYIQKTGIYDYLGSTAIFTNECLAEKIIKKIPNLFLLLKGDLAKSEKLYEIFKENGGELDSLNNNEDIYENPALIRDYQEKFKDRKAIVDEVSKLIGFSPMCFLQNARVLDQDVVNGIGIENVAIIIKNIEVPNLVPNLDDLIDSYGAQNFFSIFKICQQFIHVEGYDPEPIVFDPELFSKYCTNMTEYKDVLSKEENLQDFFMNNIIPFSKILFGEKLDLHSREDFNNYTKKVTDNFVEEYNRFKGNPLYLGIFYNRFTRDLLGLDSLDIDRIERVYSSDISATKIRLGEKTNFQLIGEELSTRDDTNPVMTYWANILDMIFKGTLFIDNQEGLANFLYTNLGSAEGQKQIAEMIFAVNNFERLAKKLYSYEYQINLTDVSKVDTIDVRDGVEIKELKGQDFCFVVHTDSFGSKVNKGITEEKKIGKQYLCTTIQSNIHPGYARKKDAITYIYGNACKKPIFGAGTYDLYSHGDRNNSPIINTVLEERILPQKKMSKYTLQRLNEMITPRSLPTAIMVERLDDITEEHMKMAKEYGIPILSENIELYKEEHLQELLKVKQELDTNPNGSSLEEFLYKGTSYLFGYESKDYKFDGDEKFDYSNFHDTIMDVLDKIIDDKVSKQEQINIGITLNTYIRMCYAYNLISEKSEVWTEDNVKYVLLKDIFKNVESSPDKLLLFRYTYDGVDWSQIPGMTVEENHNLTLRKLGKSGREALQDDGDYIDQEKLSQMFRSIERDKDNNKDKKGEDDQIPQ